MQTPTIKRIKTTQYFKNPDTKQIYSLYQVRVDSPYWRPKYFQSEEHANAFLEARPINRENLLAEFPDESLRKYVERIHKESDQPEKKTEGPKEVNVMLTAYGARKVQVVKAIREITGLNLRESKAIVDNVPSVVKEQISEEDAAEIKRLLEAAGASVEFK
jgi:large subunit ribosomal protein L7/L12